MHDLVRFQALYVPRFINGWLREGTAMPGWLVARLQVAVHALSQLLPPEQRPLPLELVKVAASSSDVVPNGGPTWSSTGSDSACEAVRRACGQVRPELKPGQAHIGATGCCALLCGRWQGVAVYG